MAIFITPGPVQLVAASLLATGVLLLALGHRSERFSALLVGAGALLATVGVATAWGTFVRMSDGHTGWVSVGDIYLAMFDSWPYVLVLALCAAGLWTVVDRLFSHRWSGGSTVGIAVGSLVAALFLGLLDSSI